MTTAQVVVPHFLTAFSSVNEATGTCEACLTAFSIVLALL
jgi:hypothetical protein